MREFIFSLKEDSSKKASIKVDIIDDKSEYFTIMAMEGFSDTIFERHIPLGIGSVITEDDIDAIFAEFQPIFDGFKYFPNSKKTLGVAEYELTITPTITNGTETDVLVICENIFGDSFKKTVHLKNEETSVVKIIDGFDYAFQNLSENSWTSGAPESILCEGDEEVSLEITVPNELPVYELTITPTITGDTETTVTLVGTKEGYETVQHEVGIENSVDSVVEIYEGYSYEFTLQGTDAWTGGTAPEAIVCDGDETIALLITVTPA